MGLCKCPKRKVTTQFCFEHRVNVCEYCMVTSHPNCIVQSYLQWLQDSDYNPICELCTKPLGNKECVRLVCYHVYHWNCIDQFARELPSTTPVNYHCPSCEFGLFPAANLVSPVADALKSKLATVNWARSGLGLPLLIDDQKPNFEVRNVIVTDSHASSHNATPSPNPHAVVHVEDTSAFNRTDNLNLLPKRVFHDMDEPKDICYDHDENKYKRKSSWEMFFRWWRTLWRPVPQGNLYYRRYLFRVALIVIVICIILILFSWLGQIVTRDDPSLDFHNNPNIRIANIQET